MKKILMILVYLLSIFLAQSCGFKPIYLSENLEINFQNIEYKNTKLNNQIAKSLKSFSNDKGKSIYELKIDTKKIKRTISKDSKGNPETLELEIVLNLDIHHNEKNFQKTFRNKLNYNNNSNKFSLGQYENEIEKQIRSDMIEKVIKYFLNL